MFKGGYKASRICCEATTKKSIREGKPRKCFAKGYFTPTTRRYLCRFHGGAKSTDTKTRKYKGLYKNTNIDIEKKINILKNLKNFKGKTDNEIKQYIIQEQDRASNFKQYRTRYYISRITDGETAYELAKDLRINLKTLYNYLDLNPKFKEKFDKAQEHGIKTLVEKMLVLFNTDNPEVDPQYSFIY